MAAAVIRDIFNWKLEGMSNHGIANCLNFTKVLSPVEYKQSTGSRYVSSFQRHTESKWTSTSIARILKNELYIEVLTQSVSTTQNHKAKERIKKAPQEWIRVENSHEAIIARDAFGIVAQLLTRDSRIAPKQDIAHPFSGFLYCEDCQNTLVRKTVPQNGRKYFYYICSTYKNSKSCTSHSISEIKLNKAVENSIREHIKNCSTRDQFLSYTHLPVLRASKINQIKAQIETEIEKIREARHRLELLDVHLAQVVVTPDEFKLFQGNFEQRISDAKDTMSVLGDSLSFLELSGQQMDWNRCFLQYKEQDQITRKCVIELIDRIVVSKDKRIRILYRYQTKC